MVYPPSSPYFALLAIAALGQWLLPWPRLRLLLVLAASLVFYRLLQPSAWGFIVGLTVLNSLLAQGVGRVTLAVRQRRLWLGLGVGLNVLVLGSFKYLPSMLLCLGLRGAWLEAWSRWPMPLGLSFYCFESIAYLVEVSRGLPPAGLLTFASYKLFFPKLIAGPLTAFQTLRLQWQRPLWQGDRLVEGLWLIVLGCFKKLVLADRLAQPVNLIFEHLIHAGSVDLWLAIMAYGLQIYLDFSGYTDIARGSALLLRVWLPENFDAPYLSTSIADFWRRWHMTLGRWLREYLYIPLGGSRQGLIRTCTNLVLVMLLAGLWHGAAWGFVVWGGLHGVALAIQRLNQALRWRWAVYDTFWKLPTSTVLGWLLTCLTVFTSWIFFRLPQPTDFSWCLSHLWFYAGDAQFLQKIYFEALGYSRQGILILVAGLASILGLAEFIMRKHQLRVGLIAKMGILIPLVYITALFRAERSQNFIYFDF
jgi:alginate O-acetyltransferase complex protein AlgI